MAAREGGKQGPAAAADVDDGANTGEVVARRHGRRKRRGPLEHRGVEDGGVLGMPGQVLEHGHPVGGVESGLAGPDRVQDVLEWLAAPEGPVYQGPGPHRGGSAGPQPVPEDGQAERPGWRLADYAEGGEQAQDAVQRGFVRAGVCGQLRAAHRPAGQAVGNAELGHGIDRA